MAAKRRLRYRDIILRHQTGQRILDQCLYPCVNSRYFLRFGDGNQPGHQRLLYHFRELRYQGSFRGNYRKRHRRHDRDLVGRCDHDHPLSGGEPDPDRGGTNTDSDRGTDRDPDYRPDRAAHRHAYYYADCPANCYPDRYPNGRAYSHSNGGTDSYAYCRAYGYSERDTDPVGNAECDTDDYTECYTHAFGDTNNHSECNTHAIGYPDHDTERNPDGRADDDSDG